MGWQMQPWKSFSAFYPGKGIVESCTVRLGFLTLAKLRMCDV